MLATREYHSIVIASRGYDDIHSVARHRYSLGINNRTLIPPHQMPPVRPFLGTSNDGRQWNDEDRGGESEREKERRRKRLGYSLARGSSGYKQSRAHYFVRFHPLLTYLYFLLSPISPSSFTLIVASSSSSFPLHRHRRGGPALIYLHPRARRRRRGVFIFCPASTRCKVYRCDLHRFAFCFPSSCSVVVVVVLVYARRVLIRTISRSVFTRWFFFYADYITVQYNEKLDRFLYLSQSV